MKKYWKLFALLLALTLLAACGSASGETMGVNAAADYAYETATEAAIPASNADWLYDDDWAVEDAAPEEAAYSGGSFANGADLNPDADALTAGSEISASSMAEKIIYSAYAEVETTDFAQSVETIYALMDRYGAFVEGSIVNGNNLNSNGGSRSASFVLRVPRENYSAMTGALDQVGNVTYMTNTADNITAQYTDTESRQKALEVEEERLLAILAEAKTVKDMIELENRLSDIRYQKENLTAQLKNWDNQVAYSKVDINLQEVKIYTPEPEPEPETYWQQVGRGFMDTLKAMGRFFKGLFRILVAALPVLVPIAVIAAALVLVIRKKAKKDAEARAKAAEIRARAEAEYAREHAPKASPTAAEPKE